MPSAHVDFLREPSDFDLLVVCAVKVIDCTLDRLSGVLPALPLILQPVEHFVEHRLKPDMTLEVIQSMQTVFSDAVRGVVRGQKLSQLVLQSGERLLDKRGVASEQSAAILPYGEGNEEISKSRCLFAP
ncbi:hypothetical protein P4V43_15730 [Brevibacillus fortis]|uniref:hypothetical protein n=1 Tax=Brevibacillus fortis TaxID=2126352 RepID=UPI002E23DD8B|nr:hypothetical protein [Brevibacillus fortis]